ncbi:MAG: nucleotide sugar dehydrogenase [Bacteroidetes bacterium]|nr:nucleotide sugar dehydrogenase [Bacteroidota bacterium]MBU1678141.1 nucleotide sugar dehydrogenase [Bacteroidota bacterium]MBU2508022.1 nucleotide sugar dehydrogenase [Bacteroidota bacterium]
MTDYLLKKISDKSVVIGIVGLGYVGLPLGLEFAEKGIKVLGFDVDQKKIPVLKSGKTYIKHIPSERISKAVNSGLLDATSDFFRLPEVDAILIAVPTPLDEHREPDMKYIISTVDVIKKYLRKGQLVTLESTTYPGTTRELMQPEFEKAPEYQGGTSKFVVGEDFFLAFSPEREDPNNPNYNTATIPKVVGGITANCLKVAQAIYDLVIVKTVPVSSPEVAEAAKLLENIYRSVNIALVNELKMVFDKMGIDVWEVINAASTKPFGYNAFYPGPGLGGHCIPIDPFYLTWKAREFEVNTKFIELAGEINTFQPYYVVTRTMEIMNQFKKTLNGSKVLLLGAAYKKNIDDMRESPSLKLIEILHEKGAEVDYSDPYIPTLPKTRKYNYDMNSVELTEENIKQYDVVLLSTDHDDYDYKFIEQHSKIIVDTRNAFEKSGLKSSKVFKA